MHYLLVFLLFACLHSSDDKYGPVDEKEIFNTWHLEGGGNDDIESWTLNPGSIDSSRGAIWSYECTASSDTCYKRKRRVKANFHFEGDSLVIEYDLSNIEKYLITKLTKDEMILKPIQPPGKGYFEYAHRDRVLVDTLSNE